MLIHLMQHGACLPKELDPTQPLSPVGREQVEKSAKAAQRLGLNFELIIASHKPRSFQTAGIMAQGTNYPLKRIELSDTVTPMAAPQSTLDFIQEYEGLDSILITGHQPSLTRLVSTLLTGSEHLKIVIENGGLIQLLMGTGTRLASLNWHLSPAHLTFIAES